MSRSLASSRVGGATWLNRHATTRVNAACVPIGPDRRPGQHGGEQSQRHHDHVGSGVRPGQEEQQPGQPHTDQRADQGRLEGAPGRAHRRPGESQGGQQDPQAVGQRELAGDEPGERETGGEPQRVLELHRAHREVPPSAMPDEGPRRPVRVPERVVGSGVLGGHRRAEPRPDGQHQRPGAVGRLNRRHQGGRPAEGAHLSRLGRVGLVGEHPAPQVTFRLQRGGELVGRRFRPVPHQGRTHVGERRGDRGDDRDRQALRVVLDLRAQDHQAVGRRPQRPRGVGQAAVHPARRRRPLDQGDLDQPQPG